MKEFLFFIARLTYGKLSHVWGENLLKKQDILSNFSKILKTTYISLFCPILLFAQTPTPTITSTPTPAYVTTGSLQSISAGGYHACGITTDANKSVYCWGNNDYGQLGNNSTTASVVPIQVLGGEQGGEYLTGVTQVSAGDHYTCALTSGSVYCWGGNSSGELANNSNTNSKIPVIVKDEAGTGILSCINQISAGWDHTCAVDDDGTLHCWGANEFGQLGNDSTTNSNLPVKVVGGEQGGDYLDNIVQVSTSSYKYATSTSSTCAVTEDGAVYCWGFNRNGQLGNGSVGDEQFSMTPARVVGGAQGGDYLIGIKQVAASYFHSCALTTDGAVYCWGANSSYGQLGNNSTSDSAVPVRVVGGEQGGEYLTEVIQVSAQDYATCVVTTDGSVYCWGYNEKGELGNNSTTSSAVPVKVLGGAQGGTYLTNIMQVSVGGHDEVYYDDFPYTCAVTTDGKSYCWGNNDNGQLGNNSTTSSLVPVEGYDGTGTAPCTNACCSHWKKDDISTSCAGSGAYSCYGVVGDYSVVCSASEVTPTLTSTSTATSIATETYTPSNTMTETYTSSNTFTKTYTPSNTFTETYTPSNTFTETYTPSNTFTKTYTPSNTFTKTYTPSNTFTKTYTPSNTFTETYTPSNTFTNTYTPSNTFTKTYTPSNTFTETYTPSNTFTNTYTPSNTYTETYTSSNTFTKTYTPSNTFTKTYTRSRTFTKTYTPSSTVTGTYTPSNTSTEMYTPSNTFTLTATPLVGLRIVSPMTILKTYEIDKKTKNHLRIKLEKFAGASLESETVADPEASYKYIVHIRKLKRLGEKDENYRLRRKKLSIKKTNFHTFKNLDKGIYSIRYQVVISKKNITKKTKWTGKNVVFF